MKTIKLGLLGFGTVGAGVYKLVTENRGDILARERLDFSMGRILVKDFETEPNLHLAPRALFTTDIGDIVNDPDILIVVECMGGVEPARSYILRALAAGKTVVTSNKEVLAKHWNVLEAAARSSGAGLYFEATVGGGIPVIRMVLDAMQANNITSIMSIINGTTNYILTKMTEEGVTFESALKEAQALGYAEANPEADVEGWDATYKLSILSSLAFNAHIPIECIHREGITRLTPEDFAVARQLGYCIKLLAIGKREGNDIEVRVHPTMIRNTHPLASVRGAFNAIFLHGHAVDDVMLYGRGAGQLPTASAVMSDVIYAAHAAAHRHMAFENVEGLSGGVTVGRDWQSIYCIRLSVADKPGVLAKIATVFARHEVSLETVFQVFRETPVQDMVPITFITHKARELSVQAALEEIKQLSVVQRLENVIRVES